MKRFLIIAIAATLLCSCTIAPKQTLPSRVSPWAQTNILGYDRTGYIVKADWIRAYHGLLKAYGNKLPINEQVPSDDMTGITARGQNWHVDFITNKRMTDLKYLENGAGP